MLVRQRLREAGLTGYRLQWKKAPGRPDIAFPGRKIAIFVNGCFWHRCPHCNPSVPKRNTEFWEAKFRRNVERDRRAIAELEEMGWTTITIWECELKRDRIDETMERVIERPANNPRPQWLVCRAMMQPCALAQKSVCWYDTDEHVKFHMRDVIYAENSDRIPHPACAWRHHGYLVRSPAARKRVLCEHRREQRGHDREMDVSGRPVPRPLTRARRGRRPARRRNGSSRPHHAQQRGSPQR